MRNLAFRCPASNKNK